MLWWRFEHSKEEGGLHPLFYYKHGSQNMQTCFRFLLKLHSPAGRREEPG